MKAMYRELIPTMVEYFYLQRQEWKSANTGTGSGIKSIIILIKTTTPPSFPSATTKSNADSGDEGFILWYQLLCNCNLLQSVRLEDGSQWKEKLWPGINKSYARLEIKDANYFVSKTILNQ